MDCMERAQKYIEENENYKQQIKSLKFKGFLAKILNYALKFKMLIYVVPIIIILCVFSYQRLIGATISIVYFYVMCMVLRFDEDSRAMKFVNEYSESNCSINTYGLKMDIKHNEMRIKALKEGRELTPEERRKLTPEERLPEQIIM